MTKTIWCRGECPSPQLPREKAPERRDRYRWTFVPGSWRRPCPSPSRAPPSLGPRAWEGPPHPFPGICLAIPRLSLKRSCPRRRRIAWWHLRRRVGRVGGCAISPQVLLAPMVPGGQADWVLRDRASSAQPATEAAVELARPLGNSEDQVSDDRLVQGAEKVRHH